MADSHEFNRLTPGDEVNVPGSEDSDLPDVEPAFDLSPESKEVLRLAVCEPFLSARILLRVASLRSKSSGPLLGTS